MATYEKIASGIRARVRIGGKDESKTFTTKAQAIAWAKSVEEELKHIKSGGTANISLNRCLERYLESVSSKKNTEKWERIRVNAWRTLDSKTYIDFIDKKLSDITSYEIAEWRDKRLSFVSSATLIRELNLLSHVFEVARRDWGWVKSNPVKDVKRPKQPEHRTRRITDNEIEQIKISAGWDDAFIESKLQEVCAAFLFAIETAMRCGEILTLTSEHVDFKKRVVHLPKTKNGSSRNVPLSNYATSILEMIGVKETGRFFSLSSYSCDALFRKIVRRCDIENLHFHDTRREGTSRLSKKVDVLTLAKITGHKDIRMLLTYYETDMSEVAKLL